MESRELMASAAVNSAIASIQHAEVLAGQMIAAEIATLQANIVTIQNATATFNSTFAAGNKSLTSLAIRDEKFAIAQQQFLINALNQAGKQFNATANGAISGLNRSKLDPATVPNLVTSTSTSFMIEVNAINVAATFERNGLVGTFAAGKA